MNLDAVFVAPGARVEGGIGQMPGKALPGDGKHLFVGDLADAGAVHQNEGCQCVPFSSLNRPPIVLRKGRRGEGVAGARGDGCDYI